MELNTIERKLWDNFGETLWRSVQTEFNKMPDDIDEMTGWMIIESSIDMLADVYCKLPHAGISDARANEIVNGVAYLMKKKLKEQILM